MTKVDKKTTVKKGPTKLDLQAARGEAFVRLETAKALEQKSIQEINQFTVQINELEKKDSA